MNSLSTENDYLAYQINKFDQIHQIQHRFNNLKQKIFLISCSKVMRAVAGDNKICLHGVTKEFLLRRNINNSAQAETYEFSVRCTVTNLIFK